ncbi:MAG: aminopeptidase P family protein [Parasporobacterium sp.]|nr:aminopeptidase P family protein [Parasporobacterium sp.]
MDFERAKRVFQALKNAGIDKMAVSDPSSVNYLLGKYIRPGERMMVLLLSSQDERVTFLLSRLYPQEEDPGCPIIYFDDTDDYVGMLAEKIGEGETVGVDKEWQAKFLLSLMQKRPDLKIVNGSPVFDGIRQVKDAKEQEFMREASRLNDQAMARLIPLVRSGYTEKELGEELLKIYLSLGADGFSFEPICCYGANAADPHHENDDTKGKAGDSVILDIGCRKDGYCSDMTRTVFLGAVSEEQRKVYEIVKEANLRAIAAVKPGVRFCDIDAAARDHIASFGYGDYFVHRTGHNIGQDVHEYGDVSSANENTVKPGMCFSIEPGIYLAGRFGVRIEDLVLVTETGCEVLNSYPKELTVTE